MGCLGCAELNGRLRASATLAGASSQCSLGHSALRSLLSAARLATPVALLWRLFGAAHWQAALPSHASGLLPAALSL